MENNIDFYNEENKVSGTTFDLKKVGDEIKGTLVGRSEKQDTYDPNKMQQIYEIKNMEDGAVNLVWGKTTLDPQMRNIRLNQIIAIKFEGVKENKKPGMNPTHIIQVYAPQKADKSGPLMDESRIKGEAEANSAQNSVINNNQPTDQPNYVQNDEGAKVTEDDGEIKVEEVSFTDAKEKETIAPVETAVAEDPAMTQIKSLAVTKLGATEENAIVKAMEATGLAILPTNFEEIIKQLLAK